MRQKIFCRILLVLAVVLTLVSGIRVADAPVKVYDSAAAVVLMCALPAAVCGWGFLALSEGRRRDFAAAIVLNLLTVWFLCRALEDIAECYFYYVTG